MGELLCSRGAIPSSMPSCFSRIPPRPRPPHGVILRKSPLGSSTVNCWKTPFIGKRVSSCNPRRNLERRSPNSHGDLRKCHWRIHERDFQPPRDVQWSRKICGKPARERVVTCSLSSSLVCNVHEVPMDGRLFSGGPWSVLIAKQKKVGIASASREFATPRSSRRLRFPRYSENSQTYATFTDNNKFRAGFFLEPAGILRGMKFIDVSGSHIQKRRVTVYSTPPRPWWKQILFEQINEADYGLDPEDGLEDGESDMEEDDVKFGFEKDIEDDEVDSMLEDDQKFNSWQQKRKAVDELREFQETGRDPDSRDWEDWLDDSFGGYNQYMGSEDGDWYAEQPEWEKGGMPREAPKKPERGMNRTIKELLLRIFEPQEEVEEDLNFEERVFRFTSQATAKFVTILILVPWAVDFLVHDYALLPFLRRWVDEVPLAAKVLDVKQSQKLHMIERLKLERQRVRFEAEIGKAPPLSDEELNEHIREEALELREELREENRSAFANLWSDAVAGFTFFLLLVFNPQQVAIMRMTGDRVFTNISDTGKAFIIILCTDIFLGYHSESGWETVIEILLDHYGLEVSQGSIYIFVAIVPVTIDACFKLWVFRYLTRLSPSAAATFREMKRH
ncbi:unnamed protein product [Calypogeia fissa]